MKAGKLVNQIPACNNLRLLQKNEHFINYDLPMPDILLIDGH